MPIDADTDDADAVTPSSITEVLVTIFYPLNFKGWNMITFKLKANAVGHGVSA